MKIYDTMAKKKREFVPQQEGKIKLYVCGPTVYNYFHIGNARPFVFFDVARRYFLYRGFRFSDLYDIPFSFRILKNLVELGKKSEIYFVDQNKIKSWLKVRQKIKWVVEQNSVKIISNYDIDNIVLEIVGNYEVEYHRGCNLRTEKNLLYISNIKKYSHATLTLKKFYRLNRRID